MIDKFGISLSSFKLHFFLLIDYTNSQGLFIFHWQVANEDREEAMEQEADVQQRKKRARGESPSMTNKSPVSVRRADLQQRRKRARGESRSMTNKSPVCRKYIKWSESASKCVVENFECYTKGLAEKKLPSRNEIEDFLEEGAIDHMFDW
ncbi:uncharacterized protein [Apostichopus japonicus]|uniref:uncharacterized protein isoform X6 n=1 Tax=Stichopus japonicus TaxID=307972 RepID=UPI003AB14EE3